MEEDMAPGDLHVGARSVVTLVESPTMDSVPQNLNDLQSYLVNFNKEIEGNVSSEVSTPDEDISDMTVIKVGGEQLMFVEQAGGESMEAEDSKDSGLSFHDQVVSDEAPIDGLGDRIQLQELNLEQLGLQQGFSLPDGMVMLPMGDMSSFLAPQTDSRLVQIVTVNGQPTLQLVSPTSLLQQQTNTVLEGDSSQELNLLSGGTVASSGLSSPSLVSMVTSSAGGAATTLQTLQFKQDMSSPQLVALQNPDDSSESPVMALNLENLVQVGSMASSQSHQTMDTETLTQQTAAGYHSVALLPTGSGDQTGDVRYVLIVNPGAGGQGAGDKLQPPSPNPKVGVSEGRAVGMRKPGRQGQVDSLLKGQGAESLLNDGEELTCHICNYTSPQRYLLRRHMKTHLGERQHKCGLCYRAFKTLASLQNHINTHTGVRPHKCKMCESAFVTSGELVRHIRYKHTFEKPHKCTICEYASVELSKLKRHMRSHTGERPYACSHCNYASPDTYKLKRHMRIHTGEKPYTCEICSSKFTQSNSLKAHRLIHSGNKPVFQCSVCPATCGRKNDLKVHMMKLHGSNEQPLVCKKCPMEFWDRYSFKIHLKAHEGDKCYKCPECEYTASSQRQVDVHMLTVSHSSFKPFECDDCEIAYRQKQALKKHRHIYHDLINTEEIGSEDECKECEKMVRKNEYTEMNDSDNDDTTDKSQNVHTCGGFSKHLLNSLAPLTADQLIENSLLADMKEGKLGNSPKVVVVHPDGRVEEVTAKLQSLSQSKPMDDFLVSLGVTGDSHFDQVSSLPSDVSVAEVQGLMAGSHSGLTATHITSHSDVDVEADSTDSIQVVELDDTGLAHF
ncbi:CTCF-like protein [Mya arenaria]|uniref:CTCF-like protein n=1 Tax=Mya arenaria TaxID=6604 RepID=A0ABY7EQH0_MYAAR|nr:CTCF-like protein [Mya arenaria]